MAAKETNLSKKKTNLKIPLSILNGDRFVEEPEQIIVMKSYNLNVNVETEDEMSIGMGRHASISKILEDFSESSSIDNGSLSEMNCISCYNDSNAILNGGDYRQDMMMNGSTDRLDLANQAAYNNLNHTNSSTTSPKFNPNYYPGQAGGIRGGGTNDMIMGNGKDEFTRIFDYNQPYHYNTNYNPYYSSTSQQPSPSINNSNLESKGSTTTSPILTYQHPPRHRHRLHHHHGGGSSHSRNQSLHLSRSGSNNSLGGGSSNINKFINLQDIPSSTTSSSATTPTSQIQTQPQSQTQHLLFSPTMNNSPLSAVIADDEESVCTNGTNTSSATTSTMNTNDMNGMVGGGNNDSSYYYKQTTPTSTASPTLFRNRSRSFGLNKNLEGNNHGGSNNNSTSPKPMVKSISR